MGIRPAKMECWLRVSVLNLKIRTFKGNKANVLRKSAPPPGKPG